MCVLSPSRIFFLGGPSMMAMVTLGIAALNWQSMKAHVAFPPMEVQHALVARSPFAIMLDSEAEEMEEWKVMQRTCVTEGLDLKLLVSALPCLPSLPN